MKQALIVFAKWPVPGSVKTRLVPPLTELEAARLYSSFLLDALEQYTDPVLTSDVVLRVYMTGSRQSSILKSSELGPYNLFEQKGEGLGARLLRAFVETFAAGYERCIVIGTDHPTLPISFVSEAFHALKTPFSVTVGPTEDGGYYLLGMNELYSSLFEMEYSQPFVFGTTLKLIRQTNAHLTVLPEWYDVDDVSDLKRLSADLQNGANVGVRTRDSLEALLEAHPELF